MRKAKNAKKWAGTRLLKECSGPCMTKKAEVYARLRCFLKPADIPLQALARLSQQELQIPPMSDRQRRQSGQLPTNNLFCSIVEC